MKAEADVLFVGQFTGESAHRSLPGLPWLRLPVWTRLGEEQWTYEYEVERWWKGPVPPRTSIVADGGCMFGVPHSQRRMLVEAVRWRGELYSSMCERSLPIWTASQLDSLRRYDSDWIDLSNGTATEDTLRLYFGTATEPTASASLSPSLGSGRRTLLLVLVVALSALVLVRLRRRAA